MIRGRDLLVLVITVLISLAPGVVFAGSHCPRVTAAGVNNSGTISGAGGGSMGVGASAGTNGPTATPPPTVTPVPVGPQPTEPPIGPGGPICHPYDPNNPACEPKTGKGPEQPPDVKGASEQPFGGGIPPSTPTSGVTGGGDTPIPIPGQQTGQTGAGVPGTATGQPLPQQGYWCYSKATQEWYSIPYGPCPPSDMKPSGDPSSVRVPWQGLTPPPDTVAPTGGGCPPGCHIKPATGKCHCGGM